MQARAEGRDIISILEGLKGQSVSTTYVSPEFTISFTSVVETVLKTRNNELGLLLSNEGRIIANGAQLRVSGNGLIIETGPGKRLYITVLGESD